MSSRFKEAPNIKQKAGNIMKSEQRHADSTEVISIVELQREIDKGVQGDPEQWYFNLLERRLGKDRAFYARWEANGENSFEAHIPFLLSEADLVAGTSDRADFPIELAPELIQKFSKKLASYAAVPVSIPFLSIVTMFSVGLGKNLRVETGVNRELPGNIFSIIFADSGSGKSDLFRKVASPLFERQKNDRDKWKRETLPDLETDLDLANIKLSALKKKALASDFESKQEYARLKKEIASIELQMQPPEYYGEDYTIEALGTMLKNSGEQLACVSPEALKPIQNLKGLYKDGSVEDTIYNKAYSLEPGKINRVNREPDEFDEPCIALLWFTQPDKIPVLFGNEGLVKGGFVPRCISLHEYTEAQKISWESKSVDAELFEQYRRLWAELFDGYRLGGVCSDGGIEEDPFSDEGEEPKERPLPKKIITRIVKPTPEAAAHMVDHYNRLVEKRNAELHDVARFAARWTENAWRISLVFHASMYGNRAHNEPLSLETCKAATDIIDWFAAGQLQILKEGRQEAADDAAQRLYEIVQKKGGRLSKGVLLDSHNLNENEVRQLVANSEGTLRIVETGTGKRGRPSFDVEIAK